MAGRPRGCNEHELGQTPGDGEGQGGLACCSPWGCKESDTTGQLNNNNYIWQEFLFIQNPNDQKAPIKMCLIVIDFHIDNSRELKDPEGSSTLLKKQ